MRRLSLPQSLRLVPIHHLHRIGATDGGETWEMTGNDPQFLLQGKRSGYRPGMYRLSVKLGAPAILKEPKLYLDGGEGHSEAATIPLIQSDDGRRLSATFELRSRTAGLRFDPSQETGQICIESVRLRRISTTGLQLNRLARALRRRVSSPRDAASLARRSLALYRQGGFPALRQAVVREVGKHDVGIGYNSYARWIRLYDTLTPERLAAMRAEAEALPCKPLISVVMPVYNTPEKLLREAIESVRAQAYPHWEFCIADDASTAPHVRRILNEYARADRRIKVVFREENGHISRASNSALELADGEWIALLDHDDVLPAHALYWVAREINDHPDAKMIYSDEDKLVEPGVRADPYFKSDWNLYLFRSHNMFSHLGVYRSDLIRSIGGFRVGFEGAQDYDLALRCVEQVDPSEIRHIPRVLYHWRVIPGSTSMNADEKPYAMLAGERALNEHLARTSTNGTAVLVGYGYRIHYTRSEIQPKVTIVIPTRDRINLIRTAVLSIKEKTTYNNYEIIIVDNGSIEAETLSWFEDITSKTNDIRVIRDDSPFNFSRLNNRAANIAEGEFLAFVNNDVEVIAPDWLTEMVSICSLPDVGATGARLWHQNDTLQHAGIVLGLGGLAAHPHRDMPRGHHGYFGRASLIQEFSAVTAACLVTPKHLFEKCGGFCEDLTVAYNDVDYCLKLRKVGKKIVFTPYAELYHYESATRASDLTGEQRARLEREQEIMRSRWNDWIERDPYYNPNLTLNEANFSLAFPPRTDAAEAYAPRAANLQAAVP